MLSRKFFHGPFVPLVAFLVLIFALPALAQDQPKRGRKYVAPPAVSKITVTVIRESSGKPVENAAVIFHPMEDGKDKGNMEMKTNEDGKAVIDVIPIGDTVRLQVIAGGFQTFGDDYKVESDSKEILVKLKRPVRQYSVYEQHNGQTDGSNASPSPNQPQPQGGTSQAPPK
jgi:hypothetical protein